MNQEVARMMLASLGLQVVTVEDGVKAVESVNNGKYDLVLMDCHMPNLDGFAASRKIRSREERAGEKRHVPIIALTADVQKGIVERCREAGMDDYLSKPFSVEALHAVLCRYATRSRDDAHAATGQEPLMDDGWDEVGDEADLVPLTTRSA